MSAEAVPAAFSLRTPARGGTRPRRHAAHATRRGAHAGFMPVGTYGTVRGLHPAEVRARRRAGHAGQHLPPAPPARRGGGPRPGRPARLFALGPPDADRQRAASRSSRSKGSATIEEEGVAFQSHIDGSYRTITPERAMEIQWALGADIAMAVRPRGAGRLRPRRWRGRGWSARCAGWTGARRGIASCRRVRQSDSDCPRPPDPLPRPPSKRSGQSSRAERTGPPPRLAGRHPRARPVDRHRDRRALGRRAEAGDARGAGGAGPRPAGGTPRYLMGVGFPAGSAGGDRARAWTCSTAWPRRGTGGTARAWIATGRVNVAVRVHRLSEEPLDPECDCETCRRSAADICVTCSWPRRCSVSGWSRFTMCGSWSGWRAGPRARSWPAPSTAGAANGSAATT